MPLTVLDRVHLAWIWTRSAWPEYRRWRGPRERAGAGPRVYYGYEQVPGPEDMAFGGIVKVQDLQSHFPNEPSGANLLYLVSSALPHFAVRMAAMARRAGARVVVNQNGVAYPGWHGPGWEVFNRPMQRLHGLADYVFYQSAFCRESAKRFLGERTGPSEILHNPVDTEVFVPNGSITDMTNGPRLLLSGSHWSFYRVETALQTLSLLHQPMPQARLLIAGRFCWGDDPDQARRQVLATADSLGLQDRLSLIGPYTQTQAAGVLQAADILLHTKYNDPCPRLVVEAMACGLPVVYSASGGVPELVGEQAGIGIPAPMDWEMDHPPDPRKLAEAVRNIWTRYREYSLAARNRAVEHLDVRPWARRHETIFHNLLSA